VTGSGIVAGSFHSQKSNHHQRTEKAKPEKRPDRGTGGWRIEAVRRCSCNSTCCRGRIVRREADAMTDFPVEFFYFC
jgi:hypothetical protein